MATMEVRGELFNVQIDGPADAPVLILCNSLASSLAMWDDQVPALTTRFRLLRYDARGHHAASRASGDFSIEQLAQDALALLDQLGVEVAHWCGISLGGLVGQWLLAHAPSRLNRVVIANSAAYLGPPEKWQSRIDAVQAGGTAAIADASIERWFTPGFRAAQPHTAARLKAQILATPARCYLGCAAAIRDADLRESLGGVGHSVLVIGGTHDTSTTLADAHELVRRIDGARLVELDAAHLSNIEQAEAFNAAVLDFLSD